MLYCALVIHDIWCLAHLFCSVTFFTINHFRIFRGVSNSKMSAGKSLVLNLYGVVTPLLPPLLPFPIVLKVCIVQEIKIQLLQCKFLVYFMGDFFFFSRSIEFRPVMPWPLHHELCLSGVAFPVRSYRPFPRQCQKWRFSTQPNTVTVTLFMSSNNWIWKDYRILVGAKEWKRLGATDLDFIPLFQNRNEAVSFPLQIWTKLLFLLVQWKNTIPCR